MGPKVEVTYVLRSGNSKNLLGLENRILALADNMALDYELDLHPVDAPVDQGIELRLILLLGEQAWCNVSALDLIEIADWVDAILFIRDIGQPVTNAVCYRPNVGSNPAEAAARQYLARNYGKEGESIFMTPSAGHLKPEILMAFYGLQGKDKAIFVDEPSSEPKPVVYTVDLTNEETKKQIKNSLGIRNSACDLMDVTVNPGTSEVTYTVKSALWGEKEHKVVCNDLHTWPLIVKEEN